MSDLEALAKLATEATPGPWHAGIETPEDPAVWGPNDTWIANVGLWGPNATPDSVACADALYVAAASPDVVLALVRVALAAEEYLEGLGLDWYSDDLDPLRAALADLGD